MDYRSRWQEKRRLRATRTRLIAIAAMLVAAAAFAASWRSLVRPAPSGYALPSADVCWLAAGEDFILVCARSGRLARLGPGLSEDEATWPWHFTHPAGFWGAPALLSGLAYIGCEDVRLRAVDVSTGLQAWEYEAAASVPGATAAGDSVYFGDDAGMLYAISASGELRWRVELGAAVAAAPLVTDEAVVVGTLEGQVHCLDTADGSPLWTVEADGPVYCSPTMGPSSILLGDDSGAVHSITREGQRLASLQLEGLVRAPVAVHEAVVVAGDTSGTLVRINPSEMTRLWTAQLSGPIAVEPVILGDAIWCGAGSSLVEVSAEQGRIISRHVAEAQTCDLIAAHGLLYWATTDGRIMAVQPEQ
ncbi:MAG: PQQ-binding-like beta-propeller repeat protein [Armatimonadota bacterium]|nr:PQQ-binding-like beta-propeller repeat protein [Armatimonadota bacterium]